MIIITWGPTLLFMLCDRLLAYLPDVLHVIVISRELPPIRWRACGPGSILDY
jgi:hypothetical protein